MLVTSPHQLAITVRNQRKQMQISQADVADRVGLRQETISAFENKADRTKLDTLFRILAALNLEIHVVPQGTKVSGWDKEW
ncbi:MAG: helix-turn-helix domain-containing protein [Alkalinema sp. RU_4_3]|nr:helix-turn-helix domain-containing protein [Alkalinema sp. RU_4_3]